MRGLEIVAVQMFKSTASTPVVPAYPYDLVLDEDGNCLFVEAMPLLNHKCTVQAERHGKQNVFASIQQIVDDSDQYFVRPVVAKTCCNAC